MKGSLCIGGERPLREVDSMAGGSLTPSPMPGRKSPEVVKVPLTEPEFLPTPLRRRSRAASHGPSCRACREERAQAANAAQSCVHSHTGCSRESRGAKLGGGSDESPHAAQLGGDGTPTKGVRAEGGGRIRSIRRLSFAAGFLMVLAGLLLAFLVHGDALRDRDEADAAVWLELPDLFSGDRRLRHWVRRALSCPSSRQDVLDVLVGSPYEFGAESGLLEYSRIATHAGVAAASSTASKMLADDAAIEVSLADAAAHVAAGSVGPPLLRQRLLSALDTPCTAASRGDALEMHVDHSATSEGASTQGGWLQRSVIELGSSAGLPRSVLRAEAYRSKPAKVVMDVSRPIPGDCFAFRENGSVSLRSGEGDGVLVHRVGIEQPPRWVLPNGGNPPRSFSVFGEPARSGGQAAEGAAAYTTLLGKFTYLLAAPSVQVFELTEPMEVRGLRFEFEPGWGDNLTCVYRLRAYA